MRIGMIAAVAAGAMALSSAPLAEKPIDYFRANFSDAVQEAQIRNLPLMFVYGKDH